MKKQIITLAVAFFATFSAVRADTSYLLIQGGFGASNALQTYEWQVNYQSGALTTGQDLLNTVFGTPTLNGTYTDGFGGTYDYYVAGNGTQAAGYIDFGGGSLFAVSFTLNSTTVLQDPTYSPGWNYYVAGGGSNGGAGYANSGSWTSSNDGSTSRTLANGSFDGWVYGNTWPADPIVGYNPTTFDFGSTTILNVPEPGSVGLVLFGACGMLALLKRRRA